MAMQNNGSCVTASKSSAMGSGQGDGLRGQPDGTVTGTNRIPVTFWTPDGRCYEGMVSHVAGEALFVESKRLAPIGTEVTIRLVSPDDIWVDRDVARGTVVWNCPAGDDFQNLKGFGVSIQGCWPQPCGEVGPEVSKEAV
ncbi:MAG: hypothetical protein OEV08_08700 [Nitrospira sp.]|nr:hypothetical protein [Nitrospira sp.]